MSMDKSMQLKYKPCRSDLWGIYVANNKTAGKFLPAVLATICRHTTSFY